MNPKNTQTFGESPSPIASTPNDERGHDDHRDPAALGEQRRDDDAAEHHADAERDLEHREEDDVLLLAGVERAHEHERREVRRCHRQHEDDREHDEQPSHERVVRDVAHAVDEVGEVPDGHIGGAAHRADRDEREQPDPDRGGHHVDEEDRDEGCRAAARRRQTPTRRGRRLPQARGAPSRTGSSR